MRSALLSDTFLTREAPGLEKTRDLQSGGLRSGSRLVRSRSPLWRDSRRSDESGYATCMADNDVPSEGRFASTWQNRAAGRALRAARLSPEAGATQVDFAARLSVGLGIDISPATLSNYESGRRGVPTAVLIEAGLVSGRSIDDLLARSEEPRLQGRVLPPSETDLSQLLQRFEEQKQLIVSLKREVEDQALLLARVRRTLEQAGLDVVEESTEAEAPRSSRAM